MEERTMNRVLYVLLGVVAWLFYEELRRAWASRRQALWDDRYVEAVRSSPEDWRLGWRLEDLEARLHTQRFWAEALKLVAASTQRVPEAPSSASSSERLLAVVDDESQYFTIECAARKGKLVQVGPDEFRDMADRCRAFSALAPSLLGPHALWQMVPLDGAEGSVGLRAMSNGKFLRVKAPPENAAWDAPWLLETVSSLPGLAERFELRELPPEEHEEEEGEEGAFDDDINTPPARRRRLVTSGGAEMPYDDDDDDKDDELRVVPEKERDVPQEAVLVEAGAMKERSRLVMIYSELMRGYLQCGGKSLSEPVRGFAGESQFDASESHFNVSWVPSVARQRTLLEASRHVQRVSSSRNAAAVSSSSSSSSEGQRDATSSKQTRRAAAKIALVVPMTSRGTEMQSVEESPFWFNLFASFVESIDWKRSRDTFTFYLGFDRGDPLYDTGDAWSDLRKSFRSHAVRALQFLQYHNATIVRILDGGRRLAKRRQQRRHKHGRRSAFDEAKGDEATNWEPQLALKLYHFEDTLGAPSQAVSGLARVAVKEDGVDYVYQLNDDTILVSKDWADDMIAALRGSPLAPNLGVAGPLDTNNERILTHAFVHRTHVHVFDAMFPAAFKNWWSDDWISTVYGRDATFARKSVIVTHNVQSQKTGAWNRYEVDLSAHHLLHDQIQRGFVTVNAWLRTRGHRTMALPNICGYSPMITRIYDTLLQRGAAVSD